MTVIKTGPMTNPRMTDIGISWAKNVEVAVRSRH